MCGVQVDSWSNETPYEQQPQQQLVGPSKPQQKYWSWLLLKCKVQHNCLAGWPQCLASGIVFKCWSASELVVWQPDNVQWSESHSPTVIDPCVSTHCTLWGSAPGFDSVIKSLSLILTVLTPWSQHQICQPWPHSVSKLTKTKHQYDGFMNTPWMWQWDRYIMFL